MLQPDRNLLYSPSTPSRVATASLAVTMPIPGVGTRPLLMSSGTTRLTISTGMAKPMPALVPDGERIADDPAARIEQRAAGIAGAHGRVGLDHVGDFPPRAGRQADGGR
jgi:hypothetical protein